MLRHTFIHIPGIGPKTEQAWWAAGVSDWHAFGAGLPPKLPPARRERIAAELRESTRQLAAGNARYFADRLPAGQHWRLFGDFRERVAYIDIETTGLEADCDISTIALYDGRHTATYINGENLPDFVDDVRRFELLVTYNGKCFDVPVIERVLECRLEQAHIDLRYVLAGLGFKGGLKRCERALGLDRGGLADIDGLFAVVLWKAYLRNADRRALETLLSYNLQDAINLETLMVTAFNLAVERAADSPVAALPMPAAPENPYTAHRSALARYRGEVGFLRSLQSPW